MIFLIIILAISLNIDSLGVGISYGIRNIKITNFSKIIFCTLSIIYASLAIIFGRLIIEILPISVTNLIGVTILVSMGVWIILQNVFEIDIPNNRNRNSSIIMKLTKTDRNTINKDKMSFKDTLYLGTALSIDAICASIGICVAGVSSFIIPFAIGICQIIFLSIGNVIGKKMLKFTNLNKKLCFMISGLLLIFLGIIRLFA